MISLDDTIAAMATPPRGMPRTRGRRLLKRCSGATVLETYAYSATGQLTNRTDAPSSG